MDLVRVGSGRIMVTVELKGTGHISRYLVDELSEFARDFRELVKNSGIAVTDFMVTAGTVSEDLTEEVSAMISRGEELENGTRKG